MNALAARRSDVFLFLFSPPAAAEEPSSSSAAASYAAAVDSVTTVSHGHGNAREDDQLISLALSSCATCQSTVKIKKATRNH